VSSHNNENECGYNCWSEFYDSYPNPTVAIDELLFPQVYADICRQNVLEVGCGTGRHTLRLLEFENTITGIDISDGMLARLREKMNSPNLNLVKGDFLSESIPNAPFDSIVASLVLEHIPDLIGFFEASRNVLKDGGHLYLSEVHPDRTANGVFAHFKKPDGNELQLKSSPHTLDKILEAAIQKGFRVTKMLSGNGNKALANLNSKWVKYLDQPMIQIWVFQLFQ